MMLWRKLARILHIGFWVTVVTLVLGEVKICGANNRHNKKVDLVTEVHCEGVATVGVGRVRFLESRKNWTSLKLKHSLHETHET